MRRSIATPVALLALLLAAAGSLLAARPARAGGTKSFVVDDSATFEKGKLQGVASHASGRLTRAASTRRTPIDGVPVAFASAVGPDGAIYVGTGNEGAIYRVGEAGAKLFADTPAAVITSLVWVDGTLFAGSLPAGRVYAVSSDGKVREHAALAGAEHVWALAYAPKQRTLYAATGPEGKLFALDARGRAEVVHDDDAEHLLALDVDAEGRVYAGTSNGARLVRVQGREARVVYDFPGQELTAIDVGPRFVAVASNEFPAPPPASGETKDLGVAARTKRLKPGKGSAYVVDFDGHVEELAQFGETSISALAIDEASPEDALQIGLAQDGRIVRVTRAGDRALWADVDERQIAAIQLGGRAPHFLSSDGVAVHRVHAPKQEGTWISAVLDAKAPARFGELTVRATGPLRVATRSGNTEEPGAAWSKWSVEATGSGPVKSPPARFLQVRVTLAGDAELYALEAYYLPQNLPARVRNVRVKPRPLEAKGVVPLNLIWDVDNLDDDRLRYRLEVRREGSTAWRPLQREDEVLEQTEYAWDVRAVPDGHYRVRVIGSDEGSNPAPYATRAEAISAPLLVDTRAPEVRELRFEQGTLRGRAVDALGPISKLEMAIDSGAYRPFYPDDDLLDRPEERFAVKVDPLSPGVHTISVRATDAAQNTTQAAIEVGVPAH